MAWTAWAFLMGTWCLPTAAADDHEWNFNVSLDGKPIGTHRFVLRTAAGVRTLESDARFDVRILGWTAYRYRHHASERWDGDCLASIDARTDDGGNVTQLRGRQEVGGFSIDSAPPGNAGPVAGCVMSFAYWNPALAAQRKLLDPGTGRVEAVEISALAPSTLDVGGQPIAVRGLRISGPKHPIDVWYAGDKWVGLDSIVERGRRLSYRLQ